MNQPQELIDIDLTYDYLEELLEDDCKCESSHTWPGNETCTELAVSRVIGCCDAFLLCQQATVSVVSRMASGLRCNKCGAPCSECWTLAPV